MANAARRRPAGRARALVVLVCCLCAFLAQVPQARAVLPTPTISISETALTPYTSGGCFSPTKPCYVVSGTAVPGSKVTVTVTDDTTSGYSIKASAFAATQDDPGGGITAGDWSVSPNVTDLGLHGEGSSTLTFAAVTEYVGQVSPAAYSFVTKVARTALDTTGPFLTPHRAPSSPPALWSRLICLTCPPQGVLCIQNGSCGTGVIRGTAEDAHSGARGIASEVADVIIVIRQETTGAEREIHSFTRRGTTAFYNAVLRIDDFEPGSYTFVVRAVDAWGNPGNEIRGGFQVLV